MGKQVINNFLALKKKNGVIKDIKKEILQNDIVFKVN